MKSIIDECVPYIVITRLTDLSINSVQKMGWSGVKNGELLKLVESEFDVFITSDKNLRYQQNLSERKLAIILLPSNQVPVIEELLPRLEKALLEIGHGEFIILK